MLLDSHFSHLVICNWYPRSNRWKADDTLIPSRRFRGLGNLPVPLEYFFVFSLSRVKIIEIRSRAQTISLLADLRMRERQKSTLLELEINELQLRRGTSITYAFASLDILSIDRISMVNEDDAVIRCEGQWTGTSIQFDTPVLRRVYLGK